MNAATARTGGDEVVGIFLYSVGTSVLAIIFYEIFNATLRRYL